MLDVAVYPRWRGNTTDIFATVVTPVYPRWRREHREIKLSVQMGWPVYPRWRGVLALFLSGESRRSLSPLAQGTL
ncbi:hypothetical protein MJ581_15920 [Escherichia coli]|nr:hypothetical protein MJ581_15920 [Escherichia coli]